MKDKVIDLLIAGVQNKNIAEAVGCDPSYVSQVAEEAREQIAEARAGKSVAHIEHDETIDSVENKVLKRLERTVDTITDPIKLAVVFSKLNAAHRRSNTHLPQTPTGTTVTIELPEIAQVAIRVSSNNQVVEVAGRSMLPMQANQVNAMLAAQKSKKQAVELLEAPTQQLSAATSKLLASL